MFSYFISLFLEPSFVSRSESPRRLSSVPLEIELIRSFKNAVKTTKINKLKYVVLTISRKYFTFSSMSTLDATYLHVFIGF